MSIDPSRFHLINVADTCAVWNILSSTLLYGASREARCEFCMTGFVHYECLVKPRSSSSAAENELIRRLRTEQGRGAFKTYSCSIDDLQDVRLLNNRRRLGMGELSSIAFAMRIGQATITDDQRARRLAAEVGHTRTQTTPHLLSWFVFNGRFNDEDVHRVIKQHVDMEGSLEPHFRKAYEMALTCKLIAG